MSMHDKFRMLNIFVVMLTLLACGCASDRPPAGGPPDTTPLQVVYSSPAHRQTNVTTRKIELAFNNYIVGRQLLRTLAFSPSAGKYDIDTDGKHVTITFAQPLEKSRTYTLTIDKNLKDIRGSSFSKPFNLTFSTGSTIDSGIIEGRVFNQDESPADNALILAYASGPSDNISDNKIGLLHKEADYIAQTDASGAFRLGNIVPGTYRIFAIDDRNRDMRYDENTEEIALSNRTTVMTGSGNLTLRFNGLLGTPGMLATCRPIGSRTLEITLARPISTSSFDTGKIEIRNVVTNMQVPVTSWYSTNRSFQDNRFTLITGILENRQRYRISFHEGENNTANSSLEFYGISETQAHQPLSVKILPENGSDPGYLDKIWPSAGRAAILQFSTSAEKSDISRITFIEEIDNSNRYKLPCSLTALDPGTYALKPVNGFKPGHTYKVTVNTAAIGTQAYTDKTKPAESRFTAASSEDYGTISGRCLADTPMVIVEAREAGSPSSIYRTKATRDRNGSLRFTFPELPPGNYTVSAFVPASAKDGDVWIPWNPGSLKPFRPSEPFGIYPDPVKVRAKWTTENIDIFITK